ncbi:MAG: hypothetical protein ACTJLK_04685 [Anaplasma sp.]
MRRRVRRILGVALLLLASGWVAVPAARLHASIIGAEGLDEVLRCVCLFMIDSAQINADGSTQDGRALMFLPGLLRFDHYPPTSMSIVVEAGTISYYHQSRCYSSGMQHQVIALLGRAATGDRIESCVVSVEAGALDKVVHITEGSSGALLGTVSFHFLSCGSAYISALSIVESPPHNAPGSVTRIVFHNVESDAPLNERDSHVKRS